MATERDLHPEGLSTSQENLIIGLHDLNAIRFGEYKWKVHDNHPKAPLLPIYTDYRMIRRDPQVKSIGVDIFEDITDRLDYDLLADIPTAITPVVASLSDRTGEGQITSRMDSKTHGNGVKVDGLKPGDEGKIAVVMDDLVSFFDSKP
ncbi:MAG: hypothetical protein ACMG6E_02900 [Candidatus Roizmanbacteria bacterium]